MKKLMSLLLVALMLTGAFAAFAENTSDDMEYINGRIDLYALARRNGWGHAALEAYGLCYMFADCEKVGYIVQDIDGDGHPELIIAAMPGSGEFFDNMVFELYGINSYGSYDAIFTGGERDRYYSAGGALFAHNGSSGADDSFDTTEEFKNGEMIDLGTATVKDNYVQLDLTPIPAEADEGEHEHFAGMPNPWVELTKYGESPEDDCEICPDPTSPNAYFICPLGYSIGVPEGAQDVRFSMCEALSMLQMNFALDGMEFCARMKDTGFFEDISGMYYNWDFIDDVSDYLGSGGEVREAHEGDRTIQLCLWFDIIPGFSYSLDTSGRDLDGFDITAIALQVYEPMQGEA